MANDKPLRNDLAIYDANAASWWDGSVGWVRLLQDMVAGRMRHFDPVVGNWAGKDVLDLGCAGGFMAETIARLGARVTGIDPAAEAVAAAKTHAASENLTIRYDVGSGEHLPYPDQAFDIVVCVDVLEHVSSLAAVLAEIRRVLRPHGLMLFDTISRNPLASFVMVTLAENWMGLLPKGTHDPKRFIKRSELRAAFVKAGLRPGIISGFGLIGWHGRRAVFGRWPTTSIQYIGHAQQTGKCDFET